jgi:hypothetical protein
MNTRFPLSPPFAFWGICIVAVCWLAATLLFELHLGFPSSGVQWAKRLIGWFVEFWMFRTLVIGFRRRRL